ncbi:MAG TPA: hypothetical protein PKW33_02000 [Anaerolineaceae bacterium]|nr:hypothetical protein [Anaerolineaceae bacterium]HPN50332.1 hypothetical protein [Anaerolineaceae bacterium]
MKNLLLLLLSGLILIACTIYGAQAFSPTLTPNTPDLTIFGSEGQTPEPSSEKAPTDAENGTLYLLLTTQT